jgi:adenylyltransferase/sulfurtransferase
MMNMNVQSAREAGTCPCCVRGEFSFLEGNHAGVTTTLCGRDAVQVSAPSRRAPGHEVVDFAAIAAKLSGVATAPIRHNAYMLRAVIDAFEVTLFPDGRAIIKGTSDPAKARSLYAKYFGS